VSEVAVVLHYLENAYNRTPLDREATLAAWFDGIGDLEYESVQVAVRAHVQAQPYWPSIAAIRQRVVGDEQIERAWRPWVRPLEAENPPDGPPPEVRERMRALVNRATGEEADGVTAGGPERGAASPPGVATAPRSPLHDLSRAEMLALIEETMLTPEERAKLERRRAGRMEPTDKGLERWIEPYRDTAGEWRWREWARSPEGPQNVANGGEGYRNLGDVVSSAAKAAPGIPILDPETGEVMEEVG
jgi:hypothetical protein